MEKDLKETLKMMLFMDKEHFIEEMEQFTMDFGKIIF